jgi:hypothetical protein
MLKAQRGAPGGSWRLVQLWGREALRELSLREYLNVLLSQSAKKGPETYDWYTIVPR